MATEKSAFPTIATARLSLRELAPADAAVLHECWSDKAVTEYMVLDAFTNVETSARMIGLLAGLAGTEAGIRWAIALKDCGKVIGTCGFHNVKAEHSRAEMGYEMGKEYWGRGLMAEALQAILRHGYEVMNLNRVEAFVNVGNSRSVRVLERLGFKLDGTLREYEYARGRFVDQHCFSLLRGDFVGSGAGGTN